MSAASAEEAEGLERELAERVAERERHQADLAKLARERAELEDLLGAGDGPLALGPLVLTLVGSVGAMGAAFSTYLLGLFCLGSSYGPDSDTWAAVLGWLAALGIGAGGTLWGRRPGAGGRARVGLWRLSVVLLASSLVVGAVVLAIGYA